MTRAPILPPLRRTAADAEAFARVVHADQVDKAGRPYVEHLQRVAHRAYVRLPAAAIFEGRATVDEVEQIAWLHDTVEDMGISGPDLSAEGFAATVVDGVLHLTKSPGRRYVDYVAWLMDRAPVPVLIVKLADMEDNADPERLALLPDDVRARLERKYGPSLEMLRAAVERGAGR